VPEFDDKVDNPTEKSIYILIGSVLLYFVYCSTHQPFLSPRASDFKQSFTG